MRKRPDRDDSVPNSRTQQYATRYKSLLKRLETNVLIFLPNKEGLWVNLENYGNSRKCYVFNVIILA